VAVARLGGGVEPATDAMPGWLGSLEQLFPIPPAYRDASVDRQTALGVLCCGEEILDELLAQGLPSAGPRGEELFDRNDIFNLALHSGSQASVPEKAFRFALRWMSEPTSTWFRAKRWSVSFELACGCETECEPATLRLARPKPEEFGGAVISQGLEPADAHLGASRIEAGTDGPLRLTATVETRGERMEIHSSSVRRIVEEFTAEGHRWVKMPEALERNPDAVLPHGAANCICASLELERRLRASEHEAWTRRGWLLGMFDFDHTWVEVRDDDGGVKVVDCIFPLLGLMVAETNPELTAVCSGSRMNRLLPTDCKADQPLAGHTRHGRDAPLRKRVDIRREKTNPT